MAKPSSEGEIVRFLVSQEGGTRKNHQSFSFLHAGKQWEQTGHTGCSGCVGVGKNEMDVPTIFDGVDGRSRAHGGHNSKLTVQVLAYQLSKAWYQRLTVSVVLPSTVESLWDAAALTKT